MYRDFKFESRIDKRFLSVVAKCLVNLKLLFVKEVIDI